MHNEQIPLSPMPGIHRLPQVQKCPGCGHRADSAGEGKGTAKADARPPQKDDVCVCFYCYRVLRYDINLRLVEMTEPEITLLKVQDRELWENVSSQRSDIITYKRSIQDKN